MPSDKKFTIHSAAILTDAKRGQTGTMLIEGADFRQVFVSFTIDWNSRGLVTARRQSQKSKRSNPITIANLPADVIKSAKILLKNRKKTLEENNEYISRLESATNPSTYFH